jgi:long-chain acyl-CoA synthetase
VSLPVTLNQAIECLPADAPLLGGVSAAELDARVEATCRVLTGQGVSPRQPVGLSVPMGIEWCHGLLALLRLGAVPVLLGSESPEAEVQRLVRAANGRSWVTQGRPAGPDKPRLVVRPVDTTDDGEVFGLVADGAGGANRAGGVDGTGGAGGTVLLPTSGSTGEPTLVARSEASLLAEGERYRAGLDLVSEDHVVLPLPLSHAYGLGWLAAVVLTGCRADPLAPTALGSTRNLLEGGATVVALVPTIARLLALRTREHAACPRLRLAIIGAGPVDRELDDLFERAFGLRLARTYGSTETGALLAGPSQLPYGAVGWPLPGVRARIVNGDGATPPIVDGVSHDEDPGREGDTASLQSGSERVGELEVWHDELNGWHRTGDLASWDAYGSVRIVGRRSAALRRGDRWVSPTEVESVLRGLPGVRDAHVRRIGAEDRAGLLAHVVERRPGTLAPSELRAGAGEVLSPEKLPDAFAIRHHLHRSEAGKAIASPRYRLAGAAAVGAVARAYKLAMALFALDDLGVIDHLDGARDVDHVAHETGLDPAALEAALSALADAGALERGETAPGAAATTPPDGGEAQALPGNDAAAAAVLRFEAWLSCEWVSREAIATAVRTGLHARPFCTDAPPGGEEVRRYQAAMEGNIEGRTRIGMSLLKIPAGGCLLEVTGGGARYARRLVGGDPDATAVVVPATPLSDVGDPPPRVDVADPDGVDAQDFDGCVVANAVHGPGCGADIGWLLDRVGQGAPVLVDDLFIDRERGRGAELALDWLTHGGLAWPTVADLQAGMRALGGTVARRLDLDDLCSMVLIIKE